MKANWRKDFSRAANAVLQTPGRMAAMTVISVSVFYILVLSSFPGYSYQMLEAGFWYIPFHDLLANMIKTVGVFSIILTASYSIFTGMAAVHAWLQLRNTSLDRKNLVALGPGLIATGCASCGAGLLGFLGLFGALALLPMNGDLLKLGGILLLVYFLGKSGDPEICRI